MKNRFFRVVITAFLFILLSTSSFATVIVSWNEFGRKKKDCAGWGLCDAHWFPEESSSTGYYTPIEFDVVTNTYYIDILLSEALPQGDVEHQIFYIDEDIFLDTYAEIGQDLTIPIGEYPLNSAMGEFGGYRIYMQ